MSVTSEKNNCDVHLHAEIEALKEALVEKQNQLIAMETACLRESDRQVELEDSIIAWQDKYDRLYESHKRVQKVNQSLEDKLLKLVDRNSGERAQLTSDVATLSVRLAQANYNIAKLQREIERYKTDINLAIQLLQCKPDSFVPQKVSSLPMDIQSKVSSYMRLETNSHSDSEGSTSGVGVATSGSYKVLPASDSPPPICPFPPTAMVYSMRGLGKYAARNNDCNTDNKQMISPSVMAKYLEDELKASEIRHCDTCKCSTKDLTVLADEPKTYTVSVQTIVHGDTGNSLCLRCNSNLNSPSRTNSPYIMKLVKSSDSVISETKSSVSDFNDADKLFTPAKKDDLMVNPILGHHRLCDRTNLNNISLGKHYNFHHPNQQQQQQTQQHQQTIDSTAKYLLENRPKIVDDLINLRSKSNSNVNLSSNNNSNTNPNNSVNNHNLLSDKTTDSSRKDDSNNLLIGTECEDLITDSNCIQGKNADSNNDNNNNVAEIRGGMVVPGAPIKVNGCIGSEKKSLPDASLGSSGYSSTEKGKLRNYAITGSMNSLWSKTSSNEGAKMFENFNRNLIKTIKAENPKYRGPRLCALRIQNGSNNILLDNIESEVTPVVYTRRQRFLDEELDDSKDVITSKISMVMTTQTTLSPNNENSIIKTGNSINPDSSSPISSLTPSEPSSGSLNSNSIGSETNIRENSNSGCAVMDGNLSSDSNKTDNDKYCDVIHSKENSQKLDLSVFNSNGDEIPEIEAQQQQHKKEANLQISTEQQNNSINLLIQQQQLQQINNKYESLKNEKDENKIPLNNSNNSINNINQLTLIDNYLEPFHCNNSNRNGNNNSLRSNSLIIKGSESVQNKQSAYIMEGLHENSINTIPTVQTHSSSMSSSGAAGELDLQESVILRRQQLNRVAEWVQNNSKIEQQNKFTSSNINLFEKSTPNDTTTDHTSINSHENNINGNNINNYINRSNFAKIEDNKMSTPRNLHNVSSHSIDKLSSLDTSHKKYSKSLQSIQNDCKKLDAQQTLIKTMNSSSIKSANPTSITSFPREYHNSDTDDTKVLSGGCKIVSNIQQHTYLSKETLAQNNFLLNQKFYLEEKYGNRNLQKLNLHLYLREFKNEIASNINNNKSNLKDENSNDNEAAKQQHEQLQHNVDLAQMEYNVKQFLLKQNEWSMRNRSSIFSTGQNSLCNSYHNNDSGKTDNSLDNNSTKCCINNNGTINKNIEMPIITQPHRTETNL